MLILNPRLVKFGSAPWDNVLLIAVDRAANREAVEWSDFGPHVVFADVPEQRIKVTVIRDVSSDDVDAPRPGETNTLTFFTSPTASDGLRMKIAMQAVVMRVHHEISLRKGAVRTIELTPVSPDGETDPIVFTQAQNGET